MKSASLALAFFFALAQSSADPLGALPRLPVGEVALLGKVKTEIVGDFVHPAFSPDGRRLAYSRVVVRDKVELTEVLIYDFNSGQESTLLNAEASKGYAVYKSYVLDLWWADNNTLVVDISDGDVDSTLVTFDVAASRIVSEEPTPPFDALPLPPEKEGFLKRALVAFPEWRPQVLENAVQQGFALAADRYVVQKHYFHEDNHIWLLDLKDQQAVRLLELPERGYRLEGGFTWGGWLVLQLRTSEKLYLLLRRDGQGFTSVSLDSTDWSGLQVKHSSSARALFFVKQHRSYERGHNALFALDEAGLHRVTGVGELYDAAVDPAGETIALVVWQEDRRRLIIRELSAN